MEFLDRLDLDADMRRKVERHRDRLDAGELGDLEAEAFARLERRCREVLERHGRSPLQVEAARPPQTPVERAAQLPEPHLRDELEQLAAALERADAPAVRRETLRRIDRRLDALRQRDGED